jgi:hypothetical protein
MTIVHFFSHVFKFLLPTILKNFPQFFTLYYPLLSHSHKFIKKYASESFSYILRKCNPSNLPSLISICISPLKNPPKSTAPEEHHRHKFVYDHEVGELKEQEGHDKIVALGATVAGVFVEAVYGVQKKLFTQWKHILTILFEQLDKSKGWKVVVIRAIVVQILNR